MLPFIIIICAQSLVIAGLIIYLAAVKRKTAENSHNGNGSEDDKRKQLQFMVQTEKLSSLGELSAGMAHEINQPLTGISLASHNILINLIENKRNPEYLKKKLNDIISYVERIKNIIDHVRIFSRDHTNDAIGLFSVNQSITNAISLLKTQYRNHNIELVLNCDETIPEIKGAVYLFEQVILNLISNAKFAVQKKEEKKIIIRTYQNRDTIFVEVEDNGEGIKKENLKKIFNPFFTTKSPDKGTGLGLSITYGIIKEMGGLITVESREQQYTIVQIAIPKGVSEEQA